MAESVDAVIIGSGFGASVAACRLAEAGRSVVVLERGRKWSPETYPSVTRKDWIWDQDDPVDQNGWIDLRVFPNMSVVQGAGVGGGSLIYANVFIKAEQNAFNGGWPPEISYDAMSPFYDMTADMVAPEPLPDGQLTERFKLVRDGAAACGYADRFRKLDLAVSFNDDWSYDAEDPHNYDKSKSFINKHGREQGTCVHCGYCDIGCPVSAKNTLDLNYLARASANGAEIRPLHLVHNVTPAGGGYRVDFNKIDGDRLVPGLIMAKEVYFGAGSLGSTELLLKCRDQSGSLPNLSQRLGYGWSSNGDFLTPAIYKDRDISPTRGPTITGAISFLDGAVGGQEFFVQDGGFPNLLRDAFDALTGNNLPFGTFADHIFQAVAEKSGASDPAQCVMPWFGQAMDAADGRLHFERKWHTPWKKTFTLDWSPEKSIAAVQALVDMHEKLAKQTGGLPIVSPAWSLTKYLITPHPLGGCNMGTDPQNGVVDHRGKVFGYDGLYVVDGAIIPRAVGLNPSRTITAVAERIMAQRLRTAHRNSRAQGPDSSK